MYCSYLFDMASSLPLLPVLLPSKPAILHPLQSQTQLLSGQCGFAGLVALCSTPSTRG